VNPDATQPGPAPWSDDRARAVAEALAGERGALLPVLHALQDTFGYVDVRAVAIVADVLNLSRAEVHGVVTFYRDFRSAPPGRRVVQVCRAEACQAVGADDVLARARALFGIDPGATTADGRVSLDQVFCLGNCALGPSVMVDGRVQGRVDPDDLEALVARNGVAAPRASGNEDGAATVVYVPGDAAARGVAADGVAAAIAEEARGRGLSVRLVRNGSRGLLWLEPLVEVVTDAGRVAYGPVAPDDVASLFDAGFLTGASHPLAHGPTDAIPWLARQQRITFGRVGVVDPTSPDEYEATGGLAGLRRALAMEHEAICDELVESGLRGRGGAGFPAGIKWRAVADAAPGERFVCCNADEGDSGTFADRMLMEGDPFLLLEGMAIAAHVIGAREGFVYLRSEYPDARRVLQRAIDAARERGWLGDSVLGTGMSFDVTIRVGAGSYVCGEETAMLESIEGKRGVVRAKPPLPAVEGLFGRPTIINNVLTLASVPSILAEGPGRFAALGVDRSRGTQVFQLGGNIARGGIVEVPFGCTLGDLVHDFGGGTRTGRPVRAVQVGGPLGAYFPADALDVVMDYEALVAAGGLLGHGGVVAFDDTVDLVHQARFAMEFCAEESCGKCTPCRIGAVRGVELLDRVLAGDEVDAHLELLEELCEVMTDGSLCAMGGLTPLPVRSARRHFAEDFVARGGTVGVARREGAGA
jgi:formate dehydrogenase iron-sulfur subunit